MAQNRGLFATYMSGNRKRDGVPGRGGEKADVSMVLGEKGEKGNRVAVTHSESFRYLTVIPSWGSRAIFLWKLFGLPCGGGTLLGFV